MSPPHLYVDCGSISVWRLLGSGPPGPFLDGTIEVIKLSKCIACAIISSILAYDVRPASRSTGWLSWNPCQHAYDCCIARGRDEMIADCDHPVTTSRNTTSNIKDSWIWPGRILNMIVEFMLIIEKMVVSKTTSVKVLCSTHQNDRVRND